MKIVVSALEPSANVHLSVLLSHLQTHDIELCGVFDSNIVQGFQSYVSYKHLTLPPTPYV